MFSRIINFKKRSTFEPKIIKTQPKMIKTTDKLYDIIVCNIDLLPIVNRFDIKSNIGQKTIATICNEKQIDAGFFVSILNTFHSPDFFPPIEKIDLQSLVFFLTNTHNYLKNVSIPKLYQLIDELKVQVKN